jgi:hypothetical protein
MEDQTSFEVGIAAFPMEDVRRRDILEKKPQAKLKIHTSSKCWSEDMGCLVYQATFTRDADGSQRIIACDHPTCEMRGTQGLNGRSCPRFELVLKYHKTQKLQPRFGLFS